MKFIPESELIVTNDGSIYHLNLRPEDISDTIILVGDPQRVEVVTSLFDSIELKKHNREFVTHTGFYKKKRLTVLSTGIGTDNIDIVVNELDALVNIDLEKRMVKEHKSALNFIRIGTSGALQEDIPVDSYLISKTAIGFDGLLNFYSNRSAHCNIEIETAFKNHTQWDESLPFPYFVDGSDLLFSKLKEEAIPGITISAPGFYGPQGRVLRIPLAFPELNNLIKSFSYSGRKITNFEMESSAIYGLSKHLGHQAITLCAIIANRIRREYSKDYKSTVRQLIQYTLDKLID